MSIEEAVVTLKTKARFVGEDLTEPIVVAAVRAAIRHYSRYNPMLTADTMDIVSGQYIYDLPDDFLVLASFDWWPSGEPSVLWTSDVLWDTTYKSLLQAVRLSEAMPYTEVRAQQLVLSPVPAADVTVDYTYMAVHSIDDTGKYPTIPLVDEYLLVDLATAELLMSMQPGLVLDEDFSEGLLQVRGRDRPVNAMVLVRALRRGVIDKYGGH